MARTNRKSKVLITGGAGFIGSQLADRLVADGHRVIVVDDLSSGRRSYVPAEAEFHKMDIVSPAVTRLIVRERPGYVFHLAAQIDLRLSVKDPIRDAEINIHGSLRVLEGCLKAKVRKLVFSSSGGGIYHGQNVVPTPENVPCFPTSPYGVAKYAFELYLNSARHHHGLKYAALRYSNVYGPRQDMRGETGIMGIFTQKMLAGETPVIFGDGRQTRDFVYVDDVVEANVLAMRSASVGAFNISTGRESSVNRVAELLRKETGFRGRCRHGHAAPGEVRRSALDPSAAKKALGWAPTIGLEEGIRRTVKWFRSRL
jgi:UDP-glucose 4-epimerase